MVHIIYYGVLICIALLFLVLVICYAAHQYQALYLAKNLEKFLDRQGMSAYEYYQKRRDGWRKNFRYSGVFYRGRGTALLKRTVLNAARREVLDVNLKNDRDHDLFCYACIHYKSCEKKYFLSKTEFRIPTASGTDRVWYRFFCASKIEKD